MALRFRVCAPAPSDARAAVERVVELPDELREIRIGRRAGLELELPFPAVSALHARLLRTATGWTVEDLGSANGTMLAGLRLPPRLARELVPGTEIRLADVSLRLEVADHGAAPSVASGAASSAATGGPGSAGPSSAAEASPSAGRPESTGTIARRLVADLFQVPGAEVASLLVSAGPGLGQRLPFALPERVYRVGRAPSCDLVLPDDDVSREHAAFERRWDGVYVRDLDSKNGIDRGGERVRGEQRLQDGDELVLGASRLRLEDPEDRYLARMRTEEQPAALPPMGADPAGPAQAVPSGSAFTHAAPDSQRSGREAAPGVAQAASAPAAAAAKADVSPASPSPGSMAPAPAPAAASAKGDAAAPSPTSVSASPRHAASPGGVPLVAGVLALALVLAAAAWLILSK